MTESPASDRPIGFTDVDNSDEPDRLLNAMDATAQWPAVQNLREWSLPLLSGVGDVLDVGCGLGDVLMSIAEANPGPRFVGVEKSTEMIEAARTRAAGRGIEATFKEADATALPFDDGEFDAVRSERMLQHLTDPQKAVDEMTRVTKPGGRVVLIDTDWRTFGSTTDPQFEHRLRAAGSPLPSSHAGGFLRSYALGAGLTDVEVHPVVHHAARREADGSDGLPPHDVIIEFRASQGFDRAELTAYFREMTRQSDNGTLSVVLTMWGATGTVPT